MSVIPLQPQTLDDAPIHELHVRRLLVAIDGSPEAELALRAAMTAIEYDQAAITLLVVVPDMAARKRVMYEMADAYIALPGGVGTLEELFEVLCWRTLGLHPRPIGLLEVEGYWSHLVTFLDHAVDEGFLSHENRGLLLVDDDIEHLLDDLAAERTTPTL